MKNKNIFIKEFLNFSKENWWIYLFFTISSFIVFFTWRWNIIEIMILFLINLVANIFIMSAISSYNKKINKIWSIYQFFWSLIFIVLAIYWFIYKWQSQYIIWQISYIISAIKVMIFYNFWKNIKILNAIFVWILNMIFLFIFIYFSKETLSIFWFEFKFNLWLDSLITAIWFSFSSTWLMSVKDNLRFCFIYIWNLGIIFWTIIWIYYSFYKWNLNWIDLGYFLLALTSLIYFSKLLPNYIKNK